jgi:ubiquinone/menaquinone biosynthesis C-methylase UbiE
MTERRALAQQVFGQRAAYYVTSATHTDQQVLDRVVELAAPRPTDRALDVGTGTGHTALALAPHVASVQGLDLTPEMLAEAAILQQQRGTENVTWVLGDVSRLPMDDDSFEIVVCRRAAHHFTDMPLAMAEMRRVLSPSGRFVVDDRTVPDDPALDALFNELDLLHDHSHVREYTPSEWAAYCTSAGMVVDQIEVYTRHRALTSLTEDVAPEDVARILELVNGMSPAQAEALHLERRGKTEAENAAPENIWFDHHYLLVAAHRPD